MSAIKSGWQCAACLWHTTDGEVMRNVVCVPVSEGVIELVCPECHTVGNFEDYEE